MPFFHSETGAVTVDWVVLTAGLVGLGLATMSVVSTGVQDTSGDIQDQLQDNRIIRSSFFSPDLLAAMTAAITLSDGADGAGASAAAALASYEGSVAGADVTTLHNLRISNNGLSAQHAAASEALSAQVALGGAIDYDAVAAAQAGFGGTTTAAEHAALVSNDFAGDPAQYATWLSANSEVSAAKAYLAEEELRRLGELPQL